MANWKVLSLLLFLVTQSSGFHFFLEPGQKLCLIEDLPDQTLVVGEYKALTHNPSDSSWRDIPENGLQVSVADYTGHDILNVKGDNHDTFAFTSSEPGDHTICISTTSSGWFHNNVRKLKVILTLTIGEAGSQRLGSTGELDEFTQKIRDLNDQVINIRRQQDYQKEHEEKFRDTAERVNSRVWWYMLIQITVLVGTTMWQMRHLTLFLKSKKAA